MILKGNTEYLELKVLTNITSGSNDFWEENWLYTSVKGYFPGFTINFECNLRTDDIKRCWEEISNLLKGITEKVNFKTIEEGIELHFFKKSLNEILINGKLQVTEPSIYCFEFNFVTDISTLSNFKIELYAILVDYPIIGVP